MRRFNIKIAGKTYDVEVEEITSGAPAAPAAPVAAPVAAPAAPAAPAPAAAPTVVAGGEKVAAPMPGTILKINVEKGASVKKGDVLCVLEAMKMENDIQAPVDGTVTGVYTSKGATVETGAPLFTIA